MSYVKNICIIAGLLCSTQVCNAEVAESQAERVCCIDWNLKPNNTLYADTSYSNIHDFSYAVDFTFKTISKLFEDIAKQGLDIVYPDCVELVVDPWHKGSDYTCLRFTPQYSNLIEFLGHVAGIEVQDFYHGYGTYTPVETFEGLRELLNYYATHDVIGYQLYIYWNIYQGTRAVFDALAQIDMYDYYGIDVADSYSKGQIVDEGIYSCISFRKISDGGNKISKALFNILNKKRIEDDDELKRLGIW